MTRILLLGGHGKVSLLMTPHLLARSWHVTSMIRAADQKSDILAAAEKASANKDNIDVLVSSLNDVKSEADARAILAKVQPEWVVWSAGAGGKGGAAATYAIDRDAAIAFIKASARDPKITKFLMVSYYGSRRNRAPWFSDDDWSSTQKANTQTLPDYHKAKVEADECLASVTNALHTHAGPGGKAFQGICIRPGTLTDDQASGKVRLGKVGAQGKVSRADVADVAARLLETEYSGWVDMFAGDEDVGEAVDRVVRDKVDCLEGEDLDDITQRHPLD